MGNSAETRKQLGKKLGVRIADVRKAINWTQDQLAERLGVDAETISRFERGATVPSLMTLDHLANILNVSVAVLLSEAAANPTDRAIRISSWLESLPSEDSEFVLDQIKALCEYVRRKSK